MYKNIYKHLRTFYTRNSRTRTYYYYYLTALAYERDLSQHFCSTSNKNYVTSPRLKQIDKLLENMFICLFKTTQPTHTHKLCRKENSLFFCKMSHILTSYIHVNVYESIFSFTCK